MAGTNNVCVQLASVHGIFSLNATVTFRHCNVLTGRCWEEVHSGPSGNTAICATQQPPWSAFQTITSISKLILHVTILQNGPTHSYLIPQKSGTYVLWEQSTGPVGTPLAAGLRLFYTVDPSSGNNVFMGWCGDWSFGDDPCQPPGSEFGPIPSLPVGSFSSG